MGLMTLDDWNNILHFNKNEKWGDWTKIYAPVIYTLDAMREYTGGEKLIIHCAYEVDGHTEKSQHYLGFAVDFHIEGMSLISQYLLAECFGWTGIGVYPDWNNPGLHCDYRTKEINDKGSRWGAHSVYNEKTDKFENKYVALDETFIRYIIEKET